MKNKIRWKELLSKENKKKALAEILFFLFLDTLLLFMGNWWLTSLHAKESYESFLPFLIVMVLQTVPIFLPLLLFKDKDYNFGFEKITLRHIICGGLLFVGMLSIFKLFGNSCAGRPFVLDYALFRIILDAVLVSVTEELTYRGFLYTRGKKLFEHEIPAILLSSILFGASHFLVGDIQHMIMSTVTGVFLCWARAYLKNCTLVSTMIAHFLYDFLMCYLWI